MNRTNSHVTLFSHLHALITMSHTTLAQDVCPHHVIHASSAVVVFIVFDTPFCTLHRLSSSFSFSSSSMWVGSVRSALCASANEELGTFGREQSSHRIFGRDRILAISLWKGVFQTLMLDAKIASALNKIVQNSQFKKKVSLGEQKAYKTTLLSSDWRS